MVTNNAINTTNTTNGDTGSVTGPTLTFSAPTNNAGGTVKFVGSGSTMTLNMCNASARNVGIGFNSLGAVTNGNHITALGYNAAASNTSGADNVAIGFNSLFTNTEGYSNIAIGSNSMVYTAATGVFDNIAIGVSSLYNAQTTSAYNVGIGYNAMTTAGTYIGNIAIGQQALDQPTGTSSYNIALGYLGGHNYTGSESSNILFNSHGVLGESNALRIGGATGTGTQALNSAFICGITGITVAGPPVVVSTGNQLGIAPTTAFAPICGGTTTTSAWQAASTGMGTSGFVLTSTGASSLPSFQANAAVGTISGDSGSATGTTVTISSGLASTICGQSVSFSGTSATLSLNLTDGTNFNTLLGKLCGNATGMGATSENTAVGYSALRVLASGGGFNTAVGTNTLFAATSATHNVALGARSLIGLLTGAGNIGVGYAAGLNYAGAESYNILLNSEGVVSESNALHIGSGTGTTANKLNSAYISGIQTIVVTGTPVLVSTGDQLGVATSSRRFKKDIRDMGDDSSAILQLRPVTFQWDRDSAPGLKDAPDERQFGVVAEEAAEIVPSLVNYTKDGEIIGFKYNELPAILLNELQKALKRIEILEGKLI